MRNKELTVMRFSMMMVREEELEATEVQPTPEWEENDIEDACFSKDNLLLVSMVETSFSVIVARGCEPDSPCSCCGGVNCQFNEVVVLPATAEITFSKKQMLHSLTIQFKFLNVRTDVYKTHFSSALSDSSRILKQVNEKNNVFIKSFLMEKYVTPEKQHVFLKDTMSGW